MRYMYTLDYLIETFTGHAVEHIKSQNTFRIQWCEENPGQPIPKHLMDDFNLPEALASICMEIKDFIEKAVAGGWRKHDPLANEYASHIGNAIFLDPDAWRAVGVTEGWDVISSKKRIGTTSNSFQTKLTTVTRKASIKRGSVGRMHRMVDHLAEGGSIESYLKTL